SGSAHEAASRTGSRALSLSRQPARVLILRLRHIDRAPYVTLASVEANQHSQERLHIQSIRLRSTLPAVHQDARGVHNAVAHATSAQRTVDPESVAPRLVAAHGLARLSEPELALRATDFTLERIEIARVDPPTTRLAAAAVSKRQQPSHAAQLHCHV